MKRTGKFRCEGRNTNQREGFLVLAGAVGRLVMRWGITGGLLVLEELVWVVRVEVG